MSTTVADKLSVNGNPAKIAAEAITFSDNETLQYKFDNGDLGGIIEVVKYPVPTATSIEFNGSTRKVVLNNFVADAMTATGDLSGTNTGAYSVMVSLKNKKRTAWEDDTTEDKVINWNITKKQITVPTVTNLTFIYNGNSFSPTVGTYDSNYISVTNETQTNPGNYNVVLSLIDKNNTVWADTGNTADKTVSWAITEKNISVPSVTNLSFIYSGASFSPTIGTYDSNYVAVTNTPQTEYGTYSVVLSLLDKENTSWADTNDTVDKTIAWSIAKLSVTPPTVTNLSFTYNGNSFSPTVGTYDSNHVTVTNTAQTEPGNYTTTVALKNKASTLWSDTSNTTDKTTNWSISKATPTLTSSPSSLALTSESTTGTLTFSTESDGTFSASSANTDVATVSTNGKVVTVTGVASGSTNINGSVAASTRYNAKSISVPISCSLSTKSIGLLWDGSGFYRVDKDLNVISGSNFDPTKVFPFNQISTETVDGAAGVTWPTMYGSAETVPAKGTYGRVWWIDEEPETNNHVLPSFVADGVTKSTLWLKATLEGNTTYNNLCTKTKNTVMNYYDYALLQKLILIYYNTGTNPPQNSLAADATFLNLQQAWGHNYQWIFGADMIQSGQYSATAGNGKLRILSPTMDGSFIDTGLSPSYRWIKGNFNIGTVNGVNMGDLMFDTSAESTTNGSLTVSPFASQGFYSTVAFNSYSGYGLIGFAYYAPGNSFAWRLRKCS